MPFIVRFCVGTLLGLFIVKVVFAAPASVEMSDAQLNNLGVEFALVGKPVVAGAAVFSGKLVLPPAGDRAVSGVANSLVEQVLVHEGQWVKKGEPLVRVAGEVIAQQQLALVQAAAKQRLAADALARDKALLDEGFIAKRRLQETELEFQSAQGELLHARTALRLAGASDQALKQLEQGGAVTGQLSLVAPQAGRIAELSARAGLPLEPNTALLHIINTANIWVEVQVPVQLPTQGLLGKNLLVGDATESANPIKAKVISVAPQSSGVQSRVILAELPNTDQVFTAGQLVSVSLPSTGDKPLIELPQSALVRHEGKAHVFVREANQLKAVVVDVLGGSGSKVQVVPVDANQLPTGARVAKSGLVAVKAAWLGIGGAE